MKVLIGCAMIIAGIVLGFYVGIWVCFIGGIVQIVSELQAPVLSGQGLAFGIARVVFTSLAGYLSGAVLVAPGIKLINN